MRRRPMPAAAALVFLAGLCGACDLMLTGLAGGESPADAGHADADAGPEPCPGYSGWDVECCTVGDPCGWADDGFCDCDGTCPWDEADCLVPDAGARN